MKTKFNKIAKTIAIGIFFMALFFNVKVTLTDPFLKIDNAATAQSYSTNYANANWVCCQSKSTGCWAKDGTYFTTDYVYYGQFCP